MTDRDHTDQTVPCQRGDFVSGRTQRGWTTSPPQPMLKPGSWWSARNDGHGWAEMPGRYGIKSQRRTIARGTKHTLRVTELRLSSYWGGGDSTHKKADGSRLKVYSLLQEILEIP